jgi:hypothetical protein
MKCKWKKWCRFCGNPKVDFDLAKIEYAKEIKSLFKVIV